MTTRTDAPTTAETGLTTVPVELPGVAPADPPTLGGVIVLVLAVGLGAAFVPAIRAASADPAGVLRNDAS